jgi:hypothetical protein
MTEPAESASAGQAPKKDPMKSFRGVMAGTLIIEVIVVLLALPVIANLGGGIGTTAGVLAFGLIVGLIVTCGLLKHSWSTYVIIGLHLVMMASWFALTALGAIVFVFDVVWACLFWMRHDMAKRIREGRLPSQQT